MSHDEMSFPEGRYSGREHRPMTDTPAGARTRYDIGTRPFHLPESAYFHYGAIDDEHLELIEVLNDTISEFGADGRITGKRFAEHIDRLLRQLVLHFASEEKLMADFGYGALTEHRAHHAAILDVLTHMHSDALSHEFVGKEVVFDAFEQIINDLLKEDLAFKSMLAANCHGW